jgi:hypothetical protein
MMKELPKRSFMIVFDFYVGTVRAITLPVSLLSSSPVWAGIPPPIVELQGGLWLLWLLWLVYTQE